MDWTFSGGRRHDLRRTALAMVVVVTCLAGYSPTGCVYFIENDFLLSALRQHKWYPVLVMFACVAVCLNSATNFVWYCLMGAEFRQDLARLIFRKRSTKCKTSAGQSFHTTRKDSHPESGRKLSRLISSVPAPVVIHSTLCTIPAVVIAGITAMHVAAVSDCEPSHLPKTTHNPHRTRVSVHLKQSDSSEAKSPVDL